MNHLSILKTSSINFISENSSISTYWKAEGKPYLLMDFFGHFQSIVKYFLDDLLKVSQKQIYCTFITHTSASLLACLKCCRIMTRDLSKQKLNDETRKLVKIMALGYINFCWLLAAALNDLLYLPLFHMYIFSIQSAEEVDCYLWSKRVLATTTMHETFGSWSNSELFRFRTDLEAGPEAKRALLGPGLPPPSLEQALEPPSSVPDDFDRVHHVRDHLGLRLRGLLLCRVGDLPQDEQLVGGPWVLHLPVPDLQRLLYLCAGLPGPGPCQSTCTGLSAAFGLGKNQQGVAGTERLSVQAADIQNCQQFGGNLDQT